MKSVFARKKVMLNRHELKRQLQGAEDETDGHDDLCQSEEEVD